MDDLFQLSGKSIIMWLCIGYFIYAIYSLYRSFKKGNEQTANQDRTQTIVLLMTCVLFFLKAVGVLNFSWDQFLIGLVVLYFLIITGKSIYRLIKGESTNKKWILTHWLITFVIAATFVSYELFFTD